MKILAIDTSHASGSASFQIDDADPRTVFFGDGSSHLIDLGNAVGTLLEDASTRPADIDRIALVIGPGSFTGLRIGLAYTKGLYAALGVDVVTIGTLELLASPLLDREIRVCSMVDARKNEVYTATYHADLGGRVSSGVPVAEPEGGEPRAIVPAQLLASLDGRPVLFVGSGAVRFREEIEGALGSTATIAPDGFHQPSTAVLCGLGTHLAPLTREGLAELEPCYIRPSDAKLSSLQRIRTNDQRHTRSDE